VHWSTSAVVPNHRRSRWWDNPNSPVARLTDRGHYSDSGFHCPWHLLLSILVGNDSLRYDYV
ncbi:hypothetical protein, partial [Proteus mirabilis]|uniref:hypothetical protein n=1 Tax=Proteus mirabilis TaxID=584 RepID=UPI003C77A3BD